MFGLFGPVRTPNKRTSLREMFCSFGVCSCGGGLFRGVPVNVDRPGLPTNGSIISSRKLNEKKPRSRRRRGFKQVLGSWRPMGVGHWGRHHAEKAKARCKMSSFNGDFTDNSNGAGQRCACCARPLRGREMPGNWRNQAQKAYTHGGAGQRRSPGWKHQAEASLVR